MMAFFCPFSLPFSTVTPGQFPTNWLEPVKALNSVVLPQFGFPASTIFTDSEFSGQAGFHGNFSGPDFYCLN
ncbi:hypothetical protein CL3_32930 [butyrate-producing bacterium SM4/1]|nr:hypothetical protein CLOM621_05285 [Clostridium sp. M62/1]CBL37016.1 hypothetical protein CL3_32930 [butyrate-producing bacterium SM4/1]